MYNFFKQIAFQFDPEFAHHLSIKGLHYFPGIASSIFSQNDLDSKKYQVDMGPLAWGFPMGLAAGLDKNAESIDFFSSLAFGAIEVGTVTPLPQAGNDKPRLFRLPEESSLRNRMGFNNGGADVVYANIIKARRNGKVIGVNLGKNKITPQDKAFEDYQKLYAKFHEIADYLVINISSPNTPGLRDLQNTAELKIIFDGLKDLREESPCPLYLKISPDLSIEDIPDIVELCHNYKLDGIIATNTTIMPEKGAGGVSGKLIKERSKNIRHEVLKVIRSRDFSLDLIGVGGVDSFADLKEFWEHGGKCMQLYTSLIYKGPGVLAEIKSGIDSLLDEYNKDNVRDLLTEIHKKV